MVIGTGYLVQWNWKGKLKEQKRSLSIVTIYCHFVYLGCLQEINFFFKKRKRKAKEKHRWAIYKKKLKEWKQMSHNS